MSKVSHYEGRCTTCFARSDEKGTAKGALNWCVDHIEHTDHSGTKEIEVYENGREREI